MYQNIRIGAIPVISLFTVLALFVSVCCVFSGCKCSETKFIPSGTSTTATTLSWDAPATYTDGSSLLDLKEYRIFYSTSHSPYSTGIYFSVPAPFTSVKIKDVISLGTGTYYFVVTAVDSAGRESNPSNEVSRCLY